MLKLALESLCSILSEASAKSTRMFYLLLSLDNLKKGVSLFPSISVMLCILECLGNSQSEKCLSTKRALKMVEE